MKPIGDHTDALRLIEQYIEALHRHEIAVSGDYLAMVELTRAKTILLKVQQQVQSGAACIDATRVEYLADPYDENFEATAHNGALGQLQDLFGELKTMGIFVLHEPVGSIYIEVPGDCINNPGQDDVLGSDDLA